MDTSWLTWPNRLSIARILLLPLWIILLLNMNQGWSWGRRAALGLYLLMAFSDALDGYLARRLGQSSALGRFLDPLADKLLTTCAVVMLAIPATSVTGARLPSWVPVIALGKDVLTVIGFGLVYLVTQRVLIVPRVWGKLATLVQSLMIAATLLTPELSSWGRVAVEILWVAATAAAVIAWLDYMREGLRFVSDWHDQHRSGAARGKDKA